MSKLSYYCVKFDSFVAWINDFKVFTEEQSSEFLNDNCTYFNEIYAYICPDCVKRYSLYDETECSEEMIDELLEDIIINKKNDGFACCVDGCKNKEAIDINFNIRRCYFIDNDKEW